MSPQVLVNHDEYSGKFVALASFSDNTVVASGDNPAEVMDEAILHGNDSAVIIHVPSENLTCVY